MGLFTEEGRTSFYGGVLTRRGQASCSQEISGLVPTLDVLKSEFGLELTLTGAERARLSRFVA